jgi:hypothetical protein
VNYEMLGRMAKTKRIRIGIAAGTFAAMGLLGTGIALATDQPSSANATQSTTTAGESVSPEGATNPVDSVGGPNDQVGPGAQDQIGADVSGSSADSTGSDRAESSTTVEADGPDGPQQQDGANVGPTGTGAN